MKSSLKNALSFSGRHAMLPLAASALLLSACTTGPSSQRYPSYSPAQYSSPQRCYDCGTVESIVRVDNGRDNSRTGAVLGGVVGAIAGRALADDSSSGRQNTATVAGGVLGAVAGNAIEDRRNAETFDVTVRMDDGRRLTVNTNRLPNGLGRGSYVRWDGRDLDLLR